MRFPVHIVRLKGTPKPNNTWKTIDITVATNDFARIPILIEANKKFYETIMKEPITGFELVDTTYDTLQLADESYEERMALVDIVDEDQTQYVLPPTPTQLAYQASKKAEMDVAVDFIKKNYI